ncbi:MAG: hypothetical protein ACK5LC_10525 [Coprobacillaceae bacterium]
MGKILDWPLVLEDEKIIGCGGNQEWFDDKWARKAGCGSVSANDVYTFYTSTKTTFSKEEYLLAMEKMFAVMTPKKMGFPYACLYARRLHSKLQDVGFITTYKVFRNPEPNTTSKLVKEAIDTNNPLGLLILRHRRWQLRHDIWHWVTIFGYRETNKGLIIISDCGEKKEIPARILFEKQRFNYFKLVKFDKQ